MFIEPDGPTVRQGGSGMKVAVTGARGRLAPHVAEAFSGPQNTVQRFSRQSGGGYLSYDDLGQPDVLIHCAWSSVPLTAEEDPSRTEREDLPLIRQLIHQAPRALFVFLSSGAVYGNTGSSPADESSPLNPLGAYARGKIAAEALVREATHGHCLILRTTNILGELLDPHKPQGVLPRLIHAAQTGASFSLWGDGNTVKDYLHVSDCVAAMRHLVNRKERGVFNVGSGRSTSLLELIALIQKLSGRTITTHKLPHYAWDVSHSQILVAKLAQAGWSPRVDVEEAVRRCLAS